MEGGSRLRVADWVEVRSKEEILATLDANGELEGMPFMPEMLKYCGQRFQVYKRAHKTCDTVFPIRGRRVHRAVHLATRCSGEMHGGCQAGCLLFWKETWLKPVEGPSDRVVVRPPTTGVHRGAEGLDEGGLRRRTQIPRPLGNPEVYSCQATRLPYATTRLDWWDMRQYFEDYFSGNVSLWRLVKGLTYSAYRNLSDAGVGVGRPLRWLYDKLHPLWGGTLFPKRMGTIAVGQPTPSETLNLQPGEVVRVKSHTEILKTLNTRGANRGMYWDAEMVPYCGGTYRVLRRVTQIINERTGVMETMKSACIVLEDVACQSRYSACRLFCPRSIYPYWREIWLERVIANEAPSAAKMIAANGERDCPVQVHA